MLRLKRDLMPTLNGWVRSYLCGLWWGNHTEICLQETCLEISTESTTKTASELVETGQVHFVVLRDTIVFHIVCKAYRLVFTRKFGNEVNRLVQKFVESRLVAELWLRFWILRAWAGSRTTCFVLEFLLSTTPLTSCSSSLRGFTH